MPPLIDLTHQFWLPLNIQTFLLAACISYMGCWLLRLIAPRIGLMDQPNQRKMHTAPIPRGGGVAIYIGFAAAIVLARYYDTEVKTIVAGGLAALLLGFLDDLRGGISAVLKFCCLLALVLFMSQLGIHLKMFHSLLKWDSVAAWMATSASAAAILPPVLHGGDILLTLLWTVGIISAINAIDNMDGLATGITIIACSAYFVVASQVYSRLWGLLTIALMGACVGFMPHNFGRRARLFMGDSGSFFLGFALAMMGVQGEWSENPLIAGFIPVLILSVPMFDLLYVVLSRYVTGRTGSLREAISHCDKDHISHRLVNMGFSPRQAVLFIYLLCICLSTGSLVIRTSTPQIAVLLIFQSAIIFIAILALMAVGQKTIDTLSEIPSGEETSRDTDNKLREPAIPTTEKPNSKQG
jgi:UDP-GlcNAc:undecaprenyl-phosphate/decaprenyl-phosphate GlcNAc-1-phosphate transferase